MKPIITRHTIAEARKRKLRILLAEDNITNQKVALSMLKKIGYRADVVSNGREAVKALESIPYDLVLMDVQMPEMDGVEATRVIRDRKSAVKNHDIPIIAMTAHALKGDREKCLEAGMNDYVSKPFQPQELLEAIQRVLPGEAAPPPPETPQPAPPEQDFFDRATLLDRLFGDEELLKEIITTFVEDAAVQIKELKKAFRKKDAPLVRQYGHKLKGASGTACATAMQQTAALIEKAGEKGDLTAAEALIEKIEQEFEFLKKHLIETGILKKEGRRHDEGADR